MRCVIGPWEYIADKELGVKANPSAEDTGYDQPIPTRPAWKLPVQKPIVQTTPAPLTATPPPVSPPPPPPIVHRPPPTLVHPVLPPTPTPAQIAAEHQRRDHPTPETARPPPGKPVVADEVAAQIRWATRTLPKPLNLSDSAHRAMTPKQIFAEIKRYADLIKQQKDAENALKAAPLMPVHSPQHVTRADSYSRARAHVHQTRPRHSPALGDDEPTRFVLLFKGKSFALHPNR